MSKLQETAKSKSDAEVKSKPESAVNHLTIEERMRYYGEYFPVESLLSVIGLSDFNRREFGFILDSGQFVRNLSFSSPTKLVEFMANAGPKGAYVGAVYSRPPSRESPIQRIEWKSRELVFDIDMDEYGPIRICGCEGPQVCPICWSLMNTAMIFLTDTMVEDFGVETLYWTFSGRRGVHGWMTSRSLAELNQEQRSGIIGYLSMIHDEKRTQSVDKLPKHAVTLRDRIFRLLARPFFANSTVDQLKEFGFTRKKATEAIRKANFDLQDHEQMFKTVTPDDIQERVGTEMIRHRYPRIDKKVTMDTRRVLRIPGSIHGSTDNICHFIDDMERFTLQQAVSVREVLEETADVKKLLPVNSAQ